MIRPTHPDGTPLTIREQLERRGLKKAKRAEKAAVLWPAKVKKIPKAVKIKGIKKRVLGPGGLWSLSVRKRDGYRCVMCGKTETLQAHHWLFRRAHSTVLAVDIANGITLCYGCHIGRVHGDGDGDFILQIADKMTEKVGPEKILEMRTIAQRPSDVDLTWWEGIENSLKLYLGQVQSV